MRIAGRYPLSIQFADRLVVHLQLRRDLRDREELV
jgi:hypothetical protein